jgi:FAD:protein FMN transferase
VALLSEGEGPALYTTRFALMGGRAVVRFVDRRGRAAAETLARAVENEALRIETKFSRFRETSVVSAINRDAGRTPVAVDAETDFLVGAALELWKESGGRFDPTVGVLRKAWDFKVQRVPSPDEVAALLPLVSGASVSRRDGTIFLRRSGMEIDLGGVGKEYAVDRAAEVLREADVSSAIVEFAGDVRTVGSRGDGRPWRVGVAHPRRAGTIAFALNLRGDAGVATSGDYERGFVKDGVRYHHILDARTGWPVRGVASATAVARTAFEAGRCATLAMLLGPAEGFDLLERMPGVEGALITDTGDVLATTGLARLASLPAVAYPVLERLRRGRSVSATLHAISI